MANHAGRGWLVGLTLWMVAATSGWAEGYTTLDNETAIRTSQAVLGNKLDASLAFKDQDGRSVALGDFLGKPLVISLVFSSCTTSCTVATRFLSDVIDKARDALGKTSFNVATIGFDTAHDTPSAMAAFARRQDIRSPEWKFLSADAHTLDQLIRQLGFVYVRSTRGFDHVTQATIVDAQGIIYRQVYGDVFETPLLIGPLKELILGRPAPQEPFLLELVRQVRLFCTVYDPKRDVYRFDPSLFVGMLIGGTIILGSFVLLIREMRRSRRLRDKQ
ncbi:MAG: SCO family protein [Magnetococcus sp. DMHC-1]|nr:SCO family protein [Magnetococcales bacterium]